MKNYNKDQYSNEISLKQQLAKQQQYSSSESIELNDDEILKENLKQIENIQHSNENIINTISEGKEEQNQPFKLYKYRYVVLVVFSLVFLINTIQWVVLSPISVQTSKYYDLSYFVVSLSGLIYNLVYVIAYLPSNYILEKYGIYKGLALGCIFQTLGSILRCFINYSFMFELAGQTLNGFAQGFFGNAVAKISNNWFPPERRTLATSIMQIMNIIGAGIGFLIPSWFVTQINQDAVLSPSQISDGKRNVFYLMLTECILCSSISALFCLFFRSKPKTPPGITSSELQPEHHTHFLKQYQKIFSNKNFLVLNYAQAVLQGNFTCLANIIDFAISPFGFNDNDASLIGMMIVIFGIVGSVIFGLFIDKTRKYKISVQICCIGHVVGLGIFLLVLPRGLVSLLLVVASFIGLFTAVIPVSIEYGCEMCYPVGEARITGIIQSSGNILGALLTIIYTQCVSDKSRYRNNLYLIVMCCLGISSFVIMFFQKEVLHRKIIEDQFNQIQKQKLNSSQQNSQSYSSNIEQQY